MQSALYTGRVRHRRRVPRPHAFSYRITYVWLDLGELDEVFRGRWFWSTRRPALAWFRRADYLGDPSVPLDAAVRDRVEAATGRRPAGPVRMLTQLRNYGHCFNPVTFYYLYDPSGDSIDTIVAEITNTPWGERQSYVLPVNGDGPFEFAFDKTFHVSPFMPMRQTYRWRFGEPAQDIAVHMDNLEDGQPVFDATLVLHREAITTGALARVLLRFPASTVRVLAAIYWQALRLWLKRIPFHPHPAA
ncbi:MAG: hypothetical protein RLZZ200_380 [Pseudomonadota bacterium]|jgi:DUF1365 family protein